MAAETLYSGHAGLFSATALSPVVHAILSDRGDLRQTVKYCGSINGRTSSVLEVSKWNGNQAMASTSEGADAANQDIVSGSASITVARQSIVRDVSDLYQMAGGSVSLQMIAETVADSANSRFTDLLVALFASVTAVVGTSGDTLSYDDFRLGLNTLRSANVPSSEPIFCILNPKQINELVDSYRLETGLSVFRPQNDQILNYHGMGDAFMIDGVIVLQTDSIVTDGTDLIGCMFGFSAFGYGDGLPDGLRKTNVEMMRMPSNAAVWAELENDALSGSMRVVGNYYVGLAMIEDARAVRIRSVD